MQQSNLMKINKIEKRHAIARRCASRSLANKLRLGLLFLRVSCQNANERGCDEADAAQDSSNDLLAGAALMVIAHFVADHYGCPEQQGPRCGRKHCP